MRNLLVTNSWMIEIVFEVDANGIFSLAVDPTKSNVQTTNITIKERWQS